MKILSLNRDGSLQIMGFANYREYKPYKLRAEKTTANIIYSGSPERVKPMMANSWIVKELQMQSPGSVGWYNYLLGYGHSFRSQKDSFASVLEALEQPEFIIVFRK